MLFVRLAFVIPLSAVYYVFQERQTISEAKLFFHENVFCAIFFSTSRSLKTKCLLVVLLMAFTIQVTPFKVGLRCVKGGHGLALRGFEMFLANFNLVSDIYVSKLSLKFFYRDFK